MRVEWVGYGRAAARALAAELRRIKGDDPLRPATVVVPSNHVGVSTRRLLASGEAGPCSAVAPGLAAVTFVTVYRLAEILGAPALAGAGRRPVSTPAVAAAIRRALAQDPGVFAPVASHPATEAALVGAYKELRDLSGDARRSLGDWTRTSPRAADVVRICDAAHERLRADFYDEEDLIGAARDALGGDGAALAGLGPAVVYLPERLSRHGAGLLRAMAGREEVVVLAASTGDGRADAEITTALARMTGEAPRRPGAATPPALDGDDPHPAHGRPAPPRDPLDVVGRDRTRIVTASDADEEVRVAVRAVVDAARAGTRLDRIAVLYASPVPYGRLVHEQLAAAAVAVNGAALLPLTARVAGRTLLGLLALPAGGFRREDVFAWLAGARLHHQRRPVRVTAWERLSRDAGVVGGRAQWDTRLARLAEERRAEAQRLAEDPDEPDWRAERAREEAGRAEDLRAFVLGLIDDLGDAAAAALPWSERAAWARRHLEALLGGERSRARWPLVEEKAAERVERALDRLAGLDGPVDLEVFTHTLTLELEVDLGRVGRMGEGVLVGSLGMGAGLDLDLVVVLGLAEGTLPSRTTEDSLLPDRERQLAAGELALRHDDVERQHRQFLAALAGARRQLLCMPRGDLRRSAARLPSRWLLQVAGALAGGRMSSGDLVAAEEPWLAQVASYDAGLRLTDFPATAQEHRLRALMAEGGAGLRGLRPGTRSETAALDTVDDDVLRAGAAVVAARRSDAFTRYDGNVGGVPVPSPTARPTSATRLEEWAGCPFAYFVHQLLRVEPVEKPEERLRISPADRGSFFHEVLERFVTEVLARPEDEQPRPDDAWTASDRARLLAIADEVSGEYERKGLTGREIFWGRDRRALLADLLEFLDRDSLDRRLRRTRPVAAELAFGFGPAGIEAVAFPLDDGRTLSFRGKADRVDEADDGTIYVVDYKTGKPDAFAGLSGDDPDLGGHKLQLPVYGLAARARRGRPDAPVRTEYWFTSARGDFKRVGYELTDEVLAAVRGTMSKVVDGIEAGVFPNMPSESSTRLWVDCPYCDPDALGVVDLVRQVARKLDDKAMAPYLVLAHATTDGDRGVADD